MLAIISRLWLVISLAWMGWMLYGFNESGELRHMTLETWSMLFAPFLLRVLVLFVIFGLPRGPRVSGS